MRSIIVGTDFSKGSLVALEVAIDIANKLGSNIKLVWVKREKLLLSEEQLTIMTNLAEEQLRQMCEKYRPSLNTGTITCEIAKGKVPSALSAIATREHAPMIVVGTNGASGFEKYWMGSTAVRIVQEATCPVLTIREGFNFHKQLENIVVPIRVNVNSRQKVPPAASMAKIFGSQVHLLGLSGLKEEEASLKGYIKQAEDYLDAEGVAHTAAICDYSNYTETVLTFADERNADLIVINTEQDRIISQLFLGTNAQQMVHTSQIPVLCIHPSDIVSFAK